MEAGDRDGNRRISPPLAVRLPRAYLFDGCPNLNGRMTCILFFIFSSMPREAKQPQTL
jgi:hypothetical protein